MARVTAHTFCLTSLLRVHAAGVTKQEVWLQGRPRDAEEDIACGWQGAAPSTCRKSPDLVTLRPGQAYVVDDFLNASDIKWLSSVYKDMGHFTEAETFGSKWMELRSLPASLGVDARMEDLLRRVHGHANSHLRSQSALKEDRWAYAGEYFLDHWQFRRYSKANNLAPHLDTGLLGRCFSATLHLGDFSKSSSSAMRGGDFQIYRCRTNDCLGYGWQYDSRFPEAHGVRIDNLEKIGSVPYKPGRLIYFMAETVHAVGEVLKGDRNVLFMWMSCAPTLVNGAARNGHLAHIDHLVQKRADIHDVLPETGLSPMAVAADAGHAAVVEYLLQRRADAEVADKNGVRAIHRAARAGHLDAMEMLTKLGADVNADVEGRSALELAAQEGHLPVVRHLAAAGAQLNAKDVARDAVQRGHCPMLQFLAAEAGVDVRTAEAGESVPLMHIAAVVGEVETARCLMKLGAEVNEPDGNRGSPPLHPAAVAATPKMVEFLLAQRAVADATDNEGATALHFAAEQGHMESVRLLLDASHNRRDAVMARDAEGLSPQEKAERAGHRNVAKLLVQARKKEKKRRKKTSTEL